MKRLRNILRLCRAHDSKGEAKFVENYLVPYEAETFLGMDGTALAYKIEVRDVGGSSKVLFCGHVDTMHPKTAPLRQAIVHDKVSGLIYKNDKDPLKMPLGADNGAGCWLLLEMIDAGVPGTYLFHRGEERGGIGSAGMALHHADFLKQYKYAIAFDRRGTNSVITEMVCGRTCSDAFAQAMSDKLNKVKGGFIYTPDNTGLFTDTANYRRLIPECTNVSVGYDHEHGPSEILDVAHLVALRGALVETFAGGTGDLPVVRGVDDVDAWPDWRDKYGCGVEDYKRGWVNNRSYSTDNYGNADAEFCLDPRDSADVIGMGYKDLVKWVRMSSPEDVADLLLTMAEELEWAGSTNDVLNQEEV